MDRSSLVAAMIDHPSLALALFVAGMAGVYLEFCRPGSVVPGSVGGAAVLVALFALSRHHWRWEGVTLIVASVLCVLAELYFRSRYLALTAAILSFAAGIRLLLPPDGPRVHRWAGVALGSLLLLATFTLLHIAREARLNKTP